MTKGCLEHLERFDLLHDVLYGVVADVCSRADTVGFRFISSGTGTRAKSLRVCVRCQSQRNRHNETLTQQYMQYRDGYVMLNLCGRDTDAGND